MTYWYVCKWWSHLFVYKNEHKLVNKQNFIIYKNYVIHNFTWNYISPQDRKKLREITALMPWHIL